MSKPTEPVKETEPDQLDGILDKVKALEIELKELAASVKEKEQ